MAGLLFITAHDAHHKKVNRILLNLRDWSNTQGDQVHDTFQIVTTRHAAEAPPREEDAIPTSPPVPSGLVYDTWSGASARDVEQFLLEAYPTDVSGNIKTNFYVMVDDKGVQDGTAIFGERMLTDDVDENGEFHLTDNWHRTRLPQLYALAMWGNLSLANMEFYEWADEDADEDEDGCVPFTMEGTGISKAGRQRLNACIEEFAKDGRL